MRKLLFFILLSLTSNLYSQGYRKSTYWLDDYTVLDTVRIQVLYKFDRIPLLDEPDKIYEDLHMLQIGKNISKSFSQWYMEYKLFIDSLIRKNPDKSVPGPTRRTFNYEFYKNYPQGMLTVTDFDNHVNLSHIYEEKMPEFDWKISYETSEILGYHCQKATTTFRGRNYTAWFTMQIPVSDGPWKFKGLPGLIMKISDSEGHYSFECIGIEQPKGETIKFYKRNYTKIRRTDLEKIIYNRNRNPEAYFKSIGFEVMDPDPNHKMPTHIYNPFERE